MPRTIEDITSELIELPKKERLEIVRFLLFLDNRSSDYNDTDSVWEHEIADRVRAVENGTAIGIDYNLPCSSRNIMDSRNCSHS